MSLDFYLIRTQPVTVFSGNITHNLTKMAAEAGLYQALWHPEQIAHCAGDLIQPLQRGLALLKSDPNRFKAFNPENVWGSYDALVKFTENVLSACESHHDSTIEVSR